MPRRRCCGLVDREPECRRFIPDGGNATVVTELLVEELEAIRLKDITGQDQTVCAESMGVSRATFQRILQAARAKLATALVNGNTIIIRGGSYIVKNRVFECQDCGHVWEVEPCTEGGQHGYQIACPHCGSMSKAKIEDGQKHVCSGGHQPGHGGCCGH